MTASVARAAPVWHQVWRQGWRSLLRDLRAGELRLLVVAVALAVAALTAVGFFADRMKGGLQRDARSLLGGDAVIVSDHPTPELFIEQARARGLQSVGTLAFPTMGRAPDEQGGATRLVALKAVGAGYPLRGALQIADAAGAPPRSAASEVPPGRVWVDPALLAALSLKIGDRLLLGDASLLIERVIVSEPDRGGGFINFAPRAMINAADLPATGLVQPASRITWRLAVAAPLQRPDAEQRARAFADWARAEIERRDAAAPEARELRGVRLETLDSGRPEMSQTLARAEKFLNLVALLTALLSAVAVALAARGFASRRVDDCAMLRVLGQPQRAIAQAYAVEFTLVGLAASTIGVALGYLLHNTFVALLATFFDAVLPAVTPWPALFGLGIGLLLLFTFGLPPVLQLASVPALRVIRRDLGAPRPAALSVLGLGLAGFALLLLAVAGDPWLGGIAVGGFAAAVALFALLSYGAIVALRAGVNENTAPRWLVLATRQIVARPAHAVVQASALAVGLLALVLLVLLRTDLVDSWRAATPADAPNRFVLNIQPEQGDAFRAALAAAGVTQYDWYPMVRGRLIRRNEQPIGPDDYAEGRARGLLDREFNLSFAAEAPGHNEVVAGRWSAEEAGAVSIESGVAETLGLKLGDQLTFDVAGTVMNARVTSLRKVDWASLRVNFYAIFPSARMDALPTTYLAGFRAPGDAAQAAEFDNALVRAFPNITSVDTGATLAQVQRVLTQVVRAIEFLFAFTLAAGLLVLLASVAATREERARDIAIMRALGARAALLRQVQRAELLGVGLLAGVLASGVAMAVGWALARFVFEFSWNASPWVPLAGGAAGALLALGAGWWGLREVLNRPVVDTLRRAAE